MRIVDGLKSGEYTWYSDSICAVPELGTPIFQAFLLTQAASRTKKVRVVFKVNDCSSSQVLLTKQS